MGQRHQVFLIARVVPYNATQAKYRCIAALHHQWCYGDLPLLATRRLLTLIEQKDNAEIIRAEIQNINGKYGGSKEKPKIPPIPCSCTALLLATSWAIDLDQVDVYATDGSFVSADVGSGDVGNNDGITVIDVTDPETPAYCFVSVSGTSSSTALPRRVPLSAEQYLRSYEPALTPERLEASESDRDMEEYHLRTIAALDDVKLVTLEMLADAWPLEYKAKLEKVRKTDDQSAVPEEIPTTSDIPSLANLTIAPALEHALETGETTDIEELLWIPGKIEIIKSTLRDVSHFPDSGIPLLEKIVSQEMKAGSVDLSGYSLSPDQVLRVISSVDGLTRLNLSYNSQVTVDTISQILASSPNLKRLVLFGCDAVTDVDLKTLLETHPKLFYNLDALIHPFLLSHKGSYANAFSYIGVAAHSKMATSCSLAYFSPSSVVQALTDFLRAFTSESESPLPPDVLSSSQMAQSAFCATTRDPGMKWGERSVVMFPRSSLGAFKGEGWAFVLGMNIYREDETEDGNIWGFVQRVRKEGEDNWVPQHPQVQSDPSDEPAPFEVLDLRSFLARMEEEGRPGATEEAVLDLERILKKMEELYGARLAEPEDMGKVIGRAKWFLQLRAMLRRSATA